MRSSWKLGTAFGIGIYIHWTFLLLPILFMFQGWNDAGPGSGMVRVLVVLAMYGCVVLHELGHALMARYFGISTRDITLYPIGGVARLERMSTRPHEEIWIALAGPAVNVAISVLLAMIYIPLFGSPLAFGMANVGTFQGFLWLLAGLNISLACFNLIPAFPMDGGRVLRAVLAGMVDYVSATEVACYVGIGMAGLFMLVAVMAPVLEMPVSPTLALIGVFVIFAGLQELAMVRHREKLRNAEPIDVLPADDEPHVVRGAIDSNFSGLTWDSRINGFIRWRNGRPVATHPVPWD
jgi:Zn-dependent protease